MKRERTLRKRVLLIPFTLLLATYVHAATATVTVAITPKIGSTTTLVAPVAVGVAGCESATTTTLTFNGNAEPTTLTFTYDMSTIPETKTVAVIVNVLSLSTLTYPISTTILTPLEVITLSASGTEGQLTVSTAAKYVDVTAIANFSVNAVPIVSLLAVGIAAIAARRRKISL